jgi:hypothetical protein
MTSRRPNWNGIGWGHWDVETQEGQWVKAKGPQEYHHHLSTTLNGLIGRGFVLLGLWEDLSGDPGAEPGSWEHFKAFAPPFLSLVARYRPEVFERRARD